MSTIGKDTSPQSESTFSHNEPGMQGRSGNSQPSIPEEKEFQKAMDAPELSDASNEELVEMVLKPSGDTKDEKNEIREAAVNELNERGETDITVDYNDKNNTFQVFVDGKKVGDPVKALKFLNIFSEFTNFQSRAFYGSFITDMTTNNLDNFNSIISREEGDNADEVRAQMQLIQSISKFKFRDNFKALEEGQEKELQKTS